MLAFLGKQGTVPFNLLFASGSIRMRTTFSGARAILALAAAAALVSACSGSSTPAQPSNAGPDLHGNAMTLSRQATTLSDQRDGMIALPSTLILPAGATGLFVVASRVTTAYTATSANPGCASVAPLAIDGQSVDANGNSRVGAFTVTATTGCTTTITVTSGAGGTATVDVQVLGPSPTPSPSPTPTATCVPNPAQGSVCGGGTVS